MRTSGPSLPSGRRFASTSHRAGSGPVAIMAWASWCASSVAISVAVFSSGTSPDSAARVSMTYTTSTSEM